MATFEQAIDTVLAHEGGYVCHPNDPGGETKYGISKRQYPQLDIQALTRDEAMEIYHRDYWHPLWEKLTQPLATKLLDLAVTAGPATAVRALQQALVDESFGPLTVDGLFGPQTLQAARLCPEARLLRAYRARSAWHYVAVSRAWPEREVFLLGWLRRAVA
jgi:lysozyme family protein